MAFLQAQIKNEAATVINQLIAQADQRINALVSIRADLLSWQTTLTNNTTDYNNADRAEFNAELSRLNSRINNEL